MFNLIILKKKKETQWCAYFQIHLLAPVFGSCMVHTHNTKSDFSHDINLLNHTPLIILIWEEAFFWGLHELGLLTSFTEPYSLLIKCGCWNKCIFQLCDLWYHYQFTYWGASYKFVTWRKWINSLEYGIGSRFY